MGKGEEEKKKRKEGKRKDIALNMLNENNTKIILEKLYKTLSNMDLDLKYYIMFYYPDVGLMK